MGTNSLQSYEPEKILNTNPISRQTNRIIDNQLEKYLCKVYDSKVLGFFNRGQQTARLIPNIINGIFIRNSLPIMSGIQNDKAHLESVYRKFVILVSFLCFPAVFLLILLAEPFVLFFLTDKWSGCIIYIQIFSLSSLFIAANSININLMQVLGRSDVILKAEIIKKLIGVVLVFTMIPFGPLILAMVNAAYGILIYFFNLYFAKKLIGIRYLTQIADLMPTFVASLLMTAISYFSIFFINDNFMKMIVGGLVGLISYFILTKYIFKFDVYSKVKILRK